MEVLVGPTFTMDASSAVPPPPGLFFTATDDGEEKAAMKWVDEKEEDVLSSSSSSSIGAPDGDSEEEEEDDAVSSKGIGSLGSLDSLEDSLPIKRGLSNYFSGKSKSFVDLSEVTRAASSSAAASVKEIEKAENPFNKRRRILLANRWASASRKSSFYAWQKNNPTSMPLLTLHEEEALHDEEPNDRHRLASSSSSSSSITTTEKKQDDPEQDKWGPPPRFNQEMRRFKTTSSGSPLLSRSCFSLTDLQ